MLDLLIITGGTKGIGNYTARKCRSITKKLTVIGSSGKLEEELNCIIGLSDLRNFEETYKYQKKCFECAWYLGCEKIGIVLCASDIGQYGGLLSSNLQDWASTYNCNVLGNLAIVKSALETFGKGADYKIVFFAGGGAAYGYPDFSGYALSKAATVRAAENLSMELKKEGYKASVISLSPGAVETKMLKKVIEHGGEIKTRTDIDEPASFIYRFMNDELDSEKLNGRFLHVRDNLEDPKLEDDNHFKLRRIM